MAEKRPLCHYSGSVEELNAGDTLPGAGGGGAVAAEVVASDRKDTPSPEDLIALIEQGVVVTGSPGGVYDGTYLPLGIGACIISLAPEYQLVPGEGTRQYLGGPAGLYIAYNEGLGNWFLFEHGAANYGDTINDAATTAPAATWGEGSTITALPHLRSLSWTQLKAVLKIYNDTLYNLYVHPNHSGDVTSVADGAQTIGANKVTLAKMANMATLSVIGRDAAGAGVPEVITASSDGHVLRRSGTNLAFGTVVAAGLASDAVETLKIKDENVTYAKLQHMTAQSVLARANVLAGDPAAVALAQQTILGRLTGDVAALTAAQVKTLIGLGNCLYVHDDKAKGTPGGTFASGAWRTRTLNSTPITNTISGASMSGSAIVLPAGTYFIYASAPAYYVDAHQAQFAITLGGGGGVMTPNPILGTTEDAISSVYGSQTRSFIFGRFVVSGGSVTCELQHWAKTTRATDGFGDESNLINREVYSQVLIIQVS